MTAPMYSLLLLALFFANAPFLSTRGFGIIRLPEKRFVHHLGEWLAGLLITALIAAVLERRSGSIHAQDWEFYVVVLCLYLCFSFPAFVWRYFWHGRNRE